MEYSVVFSGQILDGCSDKDVRANLARLFRIIDELKLSRLFSGQPVVLKSDLSVEQAQKYQQTLQ